MKLKKKDSSWNWQEMFKSVFNTAYGYYDPLLIEISMGSFVKDILYIFVITAIGKFKYEQHS